MPNLMKRLACLVLALFFVTGCKPDDAKTGARIKLDASETAYDRTLSTGTLRCGYVLYAPQFMRDPNTGAMSGAFHDLTEELAKRLHLKVEWVEETNWATFVQGIRSGRFDLLCSGAWSSASEGREVGYSRPVFYSPFFAYVRADDTRFDDDLAKLNDPSVRFSVGDGQMAAIVATDEFPKAQLHSLPQTADEGLMIQEMVANRADVTLMEPFQASLFMKNNPGTLRALRPGQPVRVFPNRYVLPLGDAKFQSMIDAALEEMLNDGVVDKLIARYEAFPGSFLRVARPYQAL